MAGLLSNFSRLVVERVGIDESCLGWMFASSDLSVQVLALVAFTGGLPQRWLAFNVAGRWALTTGYGKDPAVNSVSAAFWSTAALADWLPDFRRVPSKANVSDAVSKLG